MQQKISDKLYKEIKEKAYTLASELSKKEITKILRGERFSNEEEEVIYKTTLMFPNDMEILEVYQNRSEVTVNKNGHNLTQASKVLGIPQEILQVKILEYSKYNLTELLASDVKLRRFAEQASQFETEKDEIMK